MQGVEGEKGDSTAVKIAYKPKRKDAFDTPSQSRLSRTYRHSIYIYTHLPSLAGGLRMSRYSGMKRDDEGVSVGPNLRNRTGVEHGGWCEGEDISRH